MRNRSPLRVFALTQATAGALLLACAACAANQPFTESAAVEAPPGRPAAAPALVRFEAAEASSSAKSPALVTLEKELGRATKALGGLDPAPYYIAYEVHDIAVTGITAQDGALVGTVEQRNRSLDTDVRVGDYKMDSTHPVGRESDPAPGRPEALPLSDDPLAIAMVAWRQTDLRYKAAAERFVRVKTRKDVEVEREDKAEDFTREPPVVLIDPPARISVEIPQWQNRLRALSARFRAVPEILSSSVDLNAQTYNRLFTSSEGAAVQTGRAAMRVTLVARTRGADGMDLSRTESFDAVSAAGLPGQGEMERAADRIIADLRALRSAPVAEPYIGPAILAGRAAGVFFHEIFGHRVEGHRLRHDKDAQTFVKKVGEVIMPRFISVYDDPLLTKLGAQDLNGAYQVDNEGVPAQRAALVERGVMKGFLMGRAPLRGFTRSNGHGRRQPGHATESRQANLVVQPSHAVTLKELRDRLIAEVARQGKPYGLRFEDISGGLTTTDRYSPQAFKVNPIMVWRVWPDGRPDELVRGADLVGTPLTTMSKILAASDDYQVFNGTCGAASGWVPVSAVSPSLLLQQVELQRKPKGAEKPPLLAAPVSAKDAGIKEAMEQEMARSLKELRIPNQPAPYYVAYQLDDYEMVTARATLGALTGLLPLRGRFLRADFRIGSPKYDNTGFQEGLSSRMNLVALEDDPPAVRRKLWEVSDEQYKRAVETLARKQASEKGQSESPDEAPFDFVAMPAPKVAPASGRAIAPPEAAGLQALASSLSEVFKDYPALQESDVGIGHYVGRRRLLTSENAWVDDRAGFIQVSANARTQGADGALMVGSRRFLALAAADLPSRGEMEKELREMADGLTRDRDAPLADGGRAVVLYEREAAGRFMLDVVGPHLSGTPIPKVPSRSQAPRGTELATKLGQQIAPTFLSIVDDPAAEKGPGGVALVGHYRIDAEGVPAQRVSLVEKGVLKTLLMSRTPRKEIQKSNGHARGTAQHGVSKATPSNLFVSAGKAGLTRAALLKRAAQAARIMGSGTPVYVMRKPGQLFRIENGKEVRVRGISVTGVTASALKNIVAAGKEAAVYSDADTLQVPQSVVVPALLFRDVELRKQSGRNPKLPLYPSPMAAAAAPTRTAAR